MHEIRTACQHTAQGGASVPPNSPKPRAHAGGNIPVSRLSGGEHEWGRRNLQTAGQLTVAADSPAYDPWFTNNTPSNGKGYESAVAYAVATQLGFSKDQVKWVVEPFDSSYAPGPKKFDFDINEISVTSDREQVVSFSKSYFDVNQAVVALKSNPIVNAHSPSDLPNYKFGDQVGTTSLAYIQRQIKPTKTPAVYNTLDDAVAALKTKQIDAIVIDTPTAQFMATQQVPNSTVVGQFPTTGEHYGLLFAKGNSLVTCVNQAIDKLNSAGTIRNLQTQYLSDYISIPVIQP
ncbi:MAG: ABC transporter substrate-binding protein [Candidatus Dormibacteraeota bacterium]|nr:ABC transporter substrate-binding protein [Candidatus Dormibacteraeota bacterium]